MSGNNKDNNLTAVSIKLLYPGIEIQEDVYDADAEVLIIKRGATLTAEDIEAVKVFNEGRETIYVSGDTYRMLRKKSPPIKVDNLRELEATTGYATAKVETSALLDEIASSQELQLEAIQSVSAEISHRLEVTNTSTIMSLINALAPVDEYLQRHCVDVGMLNGLFGKWLGLPKPDVDKLILIGLLHDCGKAMVPPGVLNAPRKLTVVEFEVIKMHAVFTYELLAEFPDQLRRAARGHHEKIDGTGYPDLLNKDSIPLEARITAVSDIYDAMVSQRAYKRAKSPFSVMALLQDLGKTDLDPRLVDFFILKMPKELIGKPVMMSDGSIAVVRSFDLNDIEYPMVEINGLITKSSKKWHCTSMHVEK